MDKKNLELSIIIPIFNTEKYLEECLDSILNQGLHNYEIIIINDGSTDKSREIIYKYMKDYTFIKYYEQSNFGQGTARNVGIDMAKGRFIYFMDSDDILVKGKLNEMLGIVYRNDLDAIFFDGRSFLDGQRGTEIKKQSYKRKFSYGFYSNGENLLSDLSDNNELIISPCLFIIKTHILKDNNLYFPTDHKHEDEYFTATLFLFLGKSYHLNDTVFLRRIRENSTMTNKNKIPSFKGYVHVLMYFDNFLETFKFKTINGKKAYRKKMNQVTKSAFQAYSQIENKQLIEKEYNTLVEFTKKYKYLNFITFLFVKISKNNFLLNSYSNIVHSI